MLCKGSLEISRGLALGWCWSAYGLIMCVCFLKSRISDVKPVQLCVLMFPFLKGCLTSPVLILIMCYLLRRNLYLHLKGEFTEKDSSPKNEKRVIIYTPSVISKHA